MTTMVNQPEVRGEDVPGRDQELLPQMSNLRSYYINWVKTSGVYIINSVVNYGTYWFESERLNELDDGNLCIKNRKILDVADATWVQF